MMHDEHRLIGLTAYRVYDEGAGAAEMALVPATRTRDWMDGTPQGFARRCLPMLIANQSGWHVLNSHAVRVTWDGGLAKESLLVEHDGRTGPGLAVSHFGSGILTWNLPYLFRTATGYNLQVRGPANLPKDGVAALEGIVETDWSAATFTMNWKLTRPGLSVIFEVGEPIALLVPVRRGELERVLPTLARLTDDTDLLDTYQRWAQERSTFNADLNTPGSAAAVRGWQKDYFQGRGAPIPERTHQTRLALNTFNEHAFHEGSDPKEETPHE